jgi:hypothetical protein
MSTTTCRLLSLLGCLFAATIALADDFPKAGSKKGLQVQMLDDALALGIAHATFNVNLAALVDPRGSERSIMFESQGRTFHFHRGPVEALDGQVKQLSDADMLVYLILLNYIHRDETVDAIMRHPQAPRRPPNNIAAFNLSTDEGRAWYIATIEMLAERYSREDRKHGRVVGYIVGNEVNSHSQWYALGPATAKEVAAQYHDALRTTHASVRKSSSSARVYISLDHFWGRGMTRDLQLSCGGKELVDELVRLTRASGDFDWHIAHHPYPENLFEPRSWLDKSPRPAADTPRITFKNLEQLTEYLQRPEMLYEGEPRRVILSEQGFHTPDGPDGETHQAAGFCYAWAKVDRLDGIDAFILHRHVDHAHEGGLRLGLWTRKPDSVATPDRKKKLYDVFLKADTPEWQEAFEFVLPVIGIEGWNDLP